MARIKPQALLQQSKKKKGGSRIRDVTILLCGFTVLLSIFFLYSTYRHWSLRSRIQAETGKSAEFEVEIDQPFVESKKSDIPGYAVINTSKGFITVEIFKDGTFQVIEKFVRLCEKGYFKGMHFRHVIKHYVIQAANSDSLASAEDWTLKGKHHSQLDASLKHEAFMLGTSKAKNVNKGFELFITTAPIPDLTEKLVVFGRIIKGEDVVQEIEEVDTDEHYRPKDQISIIDVTLKQEI